MTLRHKVIALTGLIHFALAALLAPSCAFALEQISIDSQEFRIKLNKQVRYLEDPEGTLSPKTALEKFKGGEFRQHQASSLQFGYTQSVYWVGFRLLNQLPGSHKHLLEVRYPPLDHISL